MRRVASIRQEKSGIILANREYPNDLTEEKNIFECSWKFHAETNNISDIGNRRKDNFMSYKFYGTITFVSGYLLRGESKGTILG